MTDRYLCTMDKMKFESFIRMTPDVSLKLIQILSNRLKETYDLSKRITQGDVRYRTLFLLHKISEKKLTTRLRMTNNHYKIAP
jgi:CRP/FNR family transcriptional regulator